MKILHAISSVNPEAGGPAEGLRQWGSKAATRGHCVEVVSLDAHDAPFLSSFPLRVFALGPSKGHYCYNDKLVPWLRSNIERYDGVIVNGIWQYHSFAVWRALRNSNKPYFVFTHGMLDPWFRRYYPLKHAKKWLYWPWAEYRVLRDACAVLFTSEEERLQARQSFWLYRANARVVAYGTSGPPQDKVRALETFYAQFPHLRGKRFLLFLGRIHEKKGCDLLIRAFAQQAQKDTDLQLVMAGPDQTGWASNLKEIASQLGISDRMTWTGMVRGDLKWGALYACETFILPSHQENFGIAVVEALACGKPVLISNKVNIWREIERDGAGIVADDTLAGTQRLLESWHATPAAARQAMAQNAARSFQERFTVDAMAEDLISLFHDHMEGRIACLSGRGVT